MYTKEELLVKDFVSQHKNILNSIIKIKNKKTFCLNEYDSGYSIADIIIGELFDNIEEELKRKPIDSRLLTPLLDFNTHEYINFQDFAMKYSVSTITAKKYLESYTEAGYLCKIDNKGNYKFLKPYKLVFKNLISIEAKLKNWKKALQQAYSYKLFSNMVFVLVDKHYSNQAIKNISLFEKYDIGLIVMDENGYKIINIPSYQKINSNQLVLKVNEFIIEKNPINQNQILGLYDSIMLNGLRYYLDQLKFY